MKCLYYLSSTLDETHRVSDDLHDAGVHDWFLHVVSKDEAGLKHEELHSSNYLETTSLVRDGFKGGGIGFTIGVIGAGLLMYFQPFGTSVPNFVYVALILVATLFGAWEGGLLGMDAVNQKLVQFHDEIAAGEYLILIYAHKGQGEVIKKMMSARHPEARHVATDHHFINPYAVVRRKRQHHHGQMPTAT